MANLNEEEFLVLTYYGDKKPHALHHQFTLIKTIYKKITHTKFLKIMKKFNQDGIIACYGEDYCRTPFLKRQHILSDKGDLMLREESIYRGGEFYYYKYFDRANPM